MGLFNKALAILILAFSSLTVAASPFSISEQQINHYLSEKGAINDTLGIPGLFSVDYALKDLVAQIGQKNDNRVEMSGLVDSMIHLSGKTYPAKLHLTFDAIPQYNAEKGALYLKELRILRWSGEPNSVMEQLQSVMPLLSDGIAALLSQMPVYTLDESDMKEMLIKKFAKEIKVEKGRLELIGGIL